MWSWGDGSWTVRDDKGQRGVEAPGLSDGSYRTPWGTRTRDGSGGEVGMELTGVLSLLYDRRLWSRQVLPDAPLSQQPL